MGPTHENEENSFSSSELRKINKPLMEKKRRARINASLNQLKSLVLDALKRDTSRYSKLEKADILEMTVKYLRQIQRSQISASMASDTSVAGKYSEGFSECAQEVSRYLNSVELKPSVKNRLLCHINEKVSKLQGRSVGSSSNIQPFQNQYCVGTTTPMSNSVLQQQNTNILISNQTVPSCHMIPATLPTGQIVFLNSSNVNPVHVYEGSNVINYNDHELSTSDIPICSKPMRSFHANPVPTMHRSLVLSDLNLEQCDLPTDTLDLRKSYSSHVSNSFDKHSSSLCFSPNKENQIQNSLSNNECLNAIEPRSTKSELLSPISMYSNSSDEDVWRPW